MPSRDTFTSLPDVPDQPPYKIYIGNVPYELTEEVLSDVFKGLQARYWTFFLLCVNCGTLYQTALLRADS